MPRAPRISEPGELPARRRKYGPARAPQRPAYTADRSTDLELTHEPRHADPALSRAARSLQGAREFGADKRLRELSLTVKNC
jgi:hypothetical protein